MRERAGEFWRDDRPWARFHPMLPNKPRGVPRSDDRGVISGIAYVLQWGGGGRMRPLFPSRPRRFTIATCAVMPRRVAGAG